MGKFPKKVGTSDSAIDKAEQELGIKYPLLLRNMLKQKNGFHWGGFEFYCVFDTEDKYHTYDNVVTKNKDPEIGWLNFIPKGYVVIASEDNMCLLLSTKKDNKVYLYNNETEELSVYANNDKELKEKLDKAEAELESLY